MHVHDALDRLDTIHDQLARVETYRGFRAVATAAVGVIGLLAALAQPTLASEDFVTYWAAVAVIGAVVGFAPALYSYAVVESELSRRRARLVFGQFLPSLVAGAIITAAVMRIGSTFSPTLPGLWAMLFGLSIIASRPYLPKAVGMVGLFYLVAGAILLTVAIDRPVPAGWMVGGVFGPGHLAVGFILARQREEVIDD